MCTKKMLAIVLGMLIGVGILSATVPTSSDDDGTGISRLALLMNPTRPLLEPGEHIVGLSGNRLPFDDSIITWCGDPDRGINIRGTYTYGGGQRYTASADLKYRAIIYFMDGAADMIVVRAAGQGTTTQPGPVLDSTRATGAGGYVWRRGNLPNAPSISAGQDFWALVIIKRHPADQYPLTVDLGPMVQDRGGFINLPEVGPQWFQINEPPFWGDMNFCIAAIITYNAGVEDGQAARSPHRVTVTPQPVRNDARINYTLDRTANVDLRIFDINGRLVRTLVSGAANPGRHSVVWDCRADNGVRVTAGAYLYVLGDAGTSETGKIIVLDK